MQLSRRSLLVPTSSLPVRPAVLQGSRPLIVDAQCQAGFGQTTGDSDPVRAAVEITLRNMAEAGIDWSILVPTGNSAPKKANQEVASIVKQHSGKFIGFATHDPQAEQGRIASLLRWEMDNLGLKGLKLRKLPTREVLDAAAALGLPVFFQSREPSDFHTIAGEFPQVPMIMTHLGATTREWAAHFEAIAIAQRYPNVYLTTSALSGYKYLEIAAKELGADKLIFVSSSPERDSRVELYRVRLLKLSPAEEAKVLGGNILRLLPKQHV